MKLPILIKDEDFKSSDTRSHFNSILIIISILVTYLLLMTVIILLLFCELYQSGHLTLNLLKDKLPAVLSILGVGLLAVILLIWKLVSKLCSWFVLSYRKQHKEINKTG
jgi:uncharacterized membrane protein